MHLSADKIDIPLSYDEFTNIHNHLPQRFHGCRRSGKASALKRIGEDDDDFE
jgi:hypothetical protein